MANRTPEPVTDALLILPAGRTARLRLRALRFDDAEALRALTDDAAIAAAIPFIPHPFTLADARAFIAQGDGGRDVFVGVWNKDGAFIGVIGVHLRGETEAEIGYWFGTAFHGQGYASEAVGAVVAAVRGCLPHRRVYAECRPANRSSWRVLEKAGFRPTGEDGERPGRKRLVLG